MPEQKKLTGDPIIDLARQLREAEQIAKGLLPHFTCGTAPSFHFLSDPGAPPRGYILCKKCGKTTHGDLDQIVELWNYENEVFAASLSFPRR